MTPDGPRPPHDGLDDLVDELAHLLGDEERARRAVSGLRDELLATPSEAMATAHLAAMAEAARSGGPAGAGPDADDAGVIDLRARRTRRIVAGGALVVAALGSTGGLAAAGVLPPVVQDAVSRAAKVVNIDLPR